MLSERKDDPGGFHASLHASFRLAALAFVLFGVVGAFLIASDAGGTLAESISQTLRYLVSPWMLIIVAIAVGFLIYGYVFLRAAPWKARDATTAEGLLRRLRLRLLLAMGLLSLGLVSIGAYFAFDLEREDHQEALEQTRTIARLKAQQVDKWLYERATAAKHTGETLQQFSLAEWSSNRDVQNAVSVLFLQILDGHPERVAVTLLSPDGKALVHTGEDVAFGDGETILEASPRNRLRIVSTRLTGSTPPKPAVSIIVPIMTAPGAKTLAALLDVTIDPSIELLGQVQQWPTPSTSGEALLVRREGDDAVYITPPRFLNPSKVTPGSVHVPLATEDFATAKAILHGDGLYEGRDYRGVEVMMASFHIEGIDWRVIAKIDRDEVLRPAYRKIRTLAVGIVGALLLAGLIVALLWRGQRAGLLAYRTHQETERGVLAKHYARMVASVRDAVFLTDSQSNIVEANEAAVRSYGYSVAEFQAMNAADLRTPEELPKYEQQWRPAVGQLGHIYQTTHRRKDGTTFPVEIANNAFEIDGATYYQAFARDVRVNRSLEVQLLRLSHLHRALFAATSILLRAR
ncbi:MAG: PAS domain S-box protein, partial [Enhydrobacter sp.]